MHPTQWLALTLTPLDPVETQNPDYQSTVIATESDPIGRLLGENPPFFTPVTMYIIDAYTCRNRVHPCVTRLNKTLPGAKLFPSFLDGENPETTTNHCAMESFISVGELFFTLRSIAIMKNPQISNF